MSIVSCDFIFKVILKRMCRFKKKLKQVVARLASQSKQQAVGLGREVFT